MQENLTSREQEILNLLLEDVSPKEIAYRLNISVKTVSFHKSNIYQKTGIVNKRELNLKYLTLTNEIKLADGSTFFIKTYDLIELKALKWNNGDDSLHYYLSWMDIYLSDIYNGDVKNLIPYNSGLGNWLKLRLSGTIDKELDHVQAVINLVKPDGNNHHLASCGYKKFSKIGPGDFSEIFYLSGNWEYTMEILNQDELPDGRIIVEINHVLNHKFKDEWLIYNGEIPDDIPNGTVMATIRNLKIEPVF